MCDCGNASHVGGVSLSYPLPCKPFLKTQPSRLPSKARQAWKKRSVNVAAEAVVLRNRLHGKVTLAILAQLVEAIVFAEGIIPTRSSLMQGVRKRVRKRPRDPRADRYRRGDSDINGKVPRVSKIARR